MATVMSGHCLHFTDEGTETQTGGTHLWIWTPVPLLPEPKCPLSLSPFCFCYLRVPPASLSFGEILGLIFSLAYSRCSINLDV